MRTRGEEVQNPKHFADVIYGRPLIDPIDSEGGRSVKAETFTTDNLKKATSHVITDSGRGGEFTQPM